MGRFPTWATLALTFATAAAAGPAGSAKAIGRRAEAQELVDAIAQGGNLNQALNRVRFLGEEAFVTTELAGMMVRLPDLERRRQVVSAVADLGHPAGEASLLLTLRDDDGAVRMASAKGLGRMKSRAAGPALVKALADPTLGVRREAARALGQLGVATHGPPVMKAALAEDDPESRAVMLAAVGRTGDKKQVVKLEPLLAHSSEATRFGAAQALVALGAPKGLAFAKGLLDSDDRHVRQQGVQLFEGASAKVAGKTLAPYLLVEDRRVAAQVARILYEGGDPTKLEWLVLQSFQAMGEARLPYEEALERLRLTDEQRAVVLRKVGVMK